MGDTRVLPWPTTAPGATRSRVLKLAEIIPWTVECPTCLQRRDAREVFRCESCGHTACGNGIGDGEYCECACMRRQALIRQIVRQELEEMFALKT